MLCGSLAFALMGSLTHVLGASCAWQAITLASLFFTAIAMLGLHRLRDIDVRAIVVHFSAVALLCGTACFFLFERETLPQTQLGGPGVLLLFGVGVSATVGKLFLTKAFAA